MRIKTLCLMAAATLALGACSKEQPVEENVIENEIVEVPEDVETGNNVADLAPLNATNEVAPAAPPPEFSQDEQMLDDADASGMTSRTDQSQAEQSSEAAER